MLPENVIGDTGELAGALAADLMREALRVIGSGRNFTLAVPGGSVAEAFFPRLARLDLDWTRVDFFTVDERAAPPTSTESNFELARSLWLDPAGVPSERRHRMRAEANDPRLAVSDYTRELLAAAGDPPRLDYVLLGVGPDGHVASLFPRHPLLRDGYAPVAFLHDSPKPPSRRMTLTLPALCAAGRIAIAALGGAKAGAVAAALSDPGSELPVGVVMRRAARVLLLLNHEAAAGISRRPSAPAD